MELLDITSRIRVQTTIKSRHGIKTFDFPKAVSFLHSGFLIVQVTDGFRRVFNLKEIDYWVESLGAHANGDASA